MYIQQSYQADLEKKRENEGRGTYTLIEFHIFMDELHFYRWGIGKTINFLVHSSKQCEAYTNVVYHYI